MDQLSNLYPNISKHVETKKLNSKTTAYRIDLSQFLTL